MAHLKSFFDTEIPVHVPKLSAEIKKKKRWKKYQLFNQIFEAIGSSRLFILCTKQPFLYDLEYIHMRRNELMPVWDFKPAGKQVLFTWRFISAAFQNNILTGMRRYFTSGSVYIIFYHLKWNFVSDKMTAMK